MLSLWWLRPVAHISDFWSLLPTTQKYIYIFKVWVNLHSKLVFSLIYKGRPSPSSCTYLQLLIPLANNNISFLTFRLYRYPNMYMYLPFLSFHSPILFHHFFCDWKPFTSASFTLTTLSFLHHNQPYHHACLGMIFFLLSSNSFLFWKLFCIQLYTLWLCLNFHRECGSWK